VSAYTVGLSAKALDWLEDCRDARLKRRIADAIDLRPQMSVRQDA
jgi:hypothetical protein